MYWKTMAMTVYYKGVKKERVGRGATRPARRAVIAGNNLQLRWAACTSPGLSPDWG